MPTAASVRPETGARDDTRRLDRRAARYGARGELWSLSQMKRVRLCGRVSARQDGSATVRITDTDAGVRGGFAGLQSCGSVWACPVCSAKVAASRQADIEHACAFWEGLGGVLAMATFTVAHRATNSLKSVWDAVADGWHQITAGRAWRRNAQTFGVEGWIRVIEVTHGENGWHVHVHVVLFLHHALAAVEQDALRRAWLGRWRAGIGKHGFSAGDRHGADLRLAHGFDRAKVLADYFTKGVYSPDGSAPAAVALEAARGDLKSARAGGSRTPFRILEDFLGRGEVEDLDLWHEWERGSKGRRQQAWSKGLRDTVRLCAERSDEDIAADELGSAADDVLDLPKHAVTASAYLRVVMLDVIDTAPTRDEAVARLVEFLTRCGIGWDPPAVRRPGQRR